MERRKQAANNREQEKLEPPEIYNNNDSALYLCLVIQKVHSSITTATLTSNYSLISQRFLT